MMRIILTHLLMDCESSLLTEKPVLLCRTGFFVRFQASLPQKESAHREGLGKKHRFHTNYRQLHLL